MGWSGGTEIFDRVAKDLMYIHNNVYDTDIPMYQVLNVLSNLEGVLEGQDWDTQNESTYWTHPIIGKILGNTFGEQLMKVYHLCCDYDFEGANLCSNAGVYLTREKAIEVIVNGLDWDLVDECVAIVASERSWGTLEKYDIAFIEEVEIE